jgi:hypothetical protein
MLRRVALVRTDVSEKRSFSIIRVRRIIKLGTTLAITSNRRTLRSTRRNIPEDGIYLNAVRLMYFVWRCCGDGCITVLYVTQDAILCLSSVRCHERVQKRPSAVHVLSRRKMTGLAYPYNLLICWSVGWVSSVGFRCGANRRQSDSATSAGSRTEHRIRMVQVLTNVITTDSAVYEIVNGSRFQRTGTNPLGVSTYFLGFAFVFYFCLIQKATCHVSCHLVWGRSAYLLYRPLSKLVWLSLCLSLDGRLCDLVVRVPNNRARGSGFDSRYYATI